jgi:subtilisin family serine protease
MATPHVAGVAALYLQNHTTASPAEVSAALVSNATSNKISSLPRKPKSPNLLLYTNY